MPTWVTPAAFNQSRNACSSASSCGTSAPPWSDEHPARQSEGTRRPFPGEHPTRNSAPPLPARPPPDVRGNRDAAGTTKILPHVRPVSRGDEERYLDAARDRTPMRGRLPPPDGHSLITIARWEDETNRPTLLHFHSSWCAAGAIRLLCRRLGTGHPGATLVSLHTVRRVALSQANIWSRRRSRIRSPLSVGAARSPESMPFPSPSRLPGFRVRRGPDVTMGVAGQALRRRLSRSTSWTRHGGAFRQRSANASIRPLYSFSIRWIREDPGSRPLALGNRMRLRYYVNETRSAVSRVVVRNFL
jgi:hypothetical protein